jgi:hypothetical protein
VRRVRPMQWEMWGGNRRFDVARYRRRALKPNDGPLGERNGAFRGPASSRVPATSPIEKKAGCNPDGNSAARGVPCDTHRLARGNTVTRHTTTSREARRRHHTSARRRHFVLVSGTKVIANPMLENLKSRRSHIFSLSRFGYVPRMASRSGSPRIGSGLNHK